MRITWELVQAVQQHLDEKNLSQRKIARLVGISRATVALIARGQYVPREPAVDEDDPLAPQGPAVRCASCGGLVYTPCRLCHIRALKQRERLVAQAGAAPQRRAA